MSEREDNLFSLLARRAAEEGDRPGLYWRDHVLSWTEVERAARRAAGGLAGLGVEPGDRVALMLPNIPPFLFIEYALYLLGAVLVPVHVLTRGEELGYLLDDSEAKVLVTWGGYHDLVEEAARDTESMRHIIEIDAGEPRENVHDFARWMGEAGPLESDPVGGGADCAQIRYTAGITGRPKGAMLSHENVLFVSGETQKALRLKPDDVVFGAMPFYHPFGGVLQLHTLHFARSSLLLQSRFDPEEALETITGGRVTVFVGLPAHFTGLIESEGEEGGGRLRFALCGGGPLDAEVRNHFESLFNARLSTVYGTCETCSTIAVNPAHREQTPQDAFGRPISGCEIRVVGEDGTVKPVDEVGEIIVRGPGVFKGYWNRPDATANAVDDEGWFHTSDLGRIDLEGWLYGVGRMHDRINRGGFSVYPREVEQVLNAHPNVYASAVIGVENHKRGEEIVAFIVPRGGSPIHEADLISYCTERIARYKVPSRVQVIPRLPRAPSGDILRRALREGWWPEEEAPGNPG